MRLANYPTQNEMETNMMAGKGHLGVQRIPAKAIPKQSNPTTKSGKGTGNNKQNDPKEKDKKKMKKIMEAQGMLEKI